MKFFSLRIQFSNLNKLSSLIQFIKVSLALYQQVDTPLVFWNLYEMIINIKERNVRTSKLLMFLLINMEAQKHEKLKMAKTEKQP